MNPAAFTPEQPADMPESYRKILKLLVIDGPMTERSVIELSGAPGAHNKLRQMLKTGLVETVHVAGSRHCGYRATHKGRRWDSTLNVTGTVAAQRTRPFDGAYMPPPCPTYRAGQSRAFSIPSAGVSC